MSLSAEGPFGAVEGNAPGAEIQRVRAPSGHAARPGGRAGSLSPGAPPPALLTPRSTRLARFAGAARGHPPT